MARLGSFSGARGFRSRGQSEPGKGGSGSSTWRPRAAAPWTRRRAPWRREKLDSALGKGKGVERGSNTYAARPKGRRRLRAQGDGDRRTARRVVAVALRAAILGVCAGRWRRVERPRSVGEELGKGRGPGLGAWPMAQACGGERRRHGVTAKTEREEME